MKIIRIIFLSLLALSLTVFTGIFIFFETFDSDQYLPQITKKASLALGRPVSIAGAGLGFSLRGITLDAGPLTIADDPGFTTQPFIKVDRVRISLDLRSLILRREIHITDILIQSPRIHFIRSQEGNINVRSFGQKIQSAASLPTPASEAGSPVSSVIASEAKQSFKNGIASSLENTPRHDTTARDVEAIGPFDTIKALPVINIKSIKIQDATISFIDQSQGMPLDIWLSGINASLNDFSLDLSKRSVRASDLKLHTDFSQLDVKMPDNSIVKNIAGVVQLNMTNLEISASGDFKANGDIIITDGLIKHFNIIKTVLSHTLVSFGGIDGTIDKLGAENTVIEKAEAEFSLHDKAVFIDNSLIKTNIFEFTAKGPVDQGLNMDMQTMLYLNTDISATLVNEFEGLKFLCDDTKRIAIDAGLKGVIPHLKYKPNKDFRKKGKKAINAMFRQLFRP